MSRVEQFESIRRDAREGMGIRALARKHRVHRRVVRAGDTELPVRWLLVEWPQGKATPVKYWLSNLPEATPLVELVRLARSRWRVEQDYRELKGALGLDHFEGAAGQAGTTT